MKRKILPSALLWVFAAMFSFSGFSQSQVQIGTGTSDQSLPIEPHYGYSYSQVIYLQSEINTVGDITELKWYFDGSSLNNSNDWTIYIGHTTKTEFASNTDWIDVSLLTQVWSSTFADPGTSGWITIDITDFAYNNTDNLVVAVDENASGYNNSSDDFYSSSVSGNRSIEYHSDNTNPDPASPPSGSLKGYIANIILEFGNTSCPTPSGLDEANISQTTVDLSWTENGTATTWDIEYGAAGYAQGTGTTITGVSTNPYTLSTGIVAGTAYDWYVRASCGCSGVSNWAGPGSFLTLAPTQSLPFTEDWETGNIGIAWNQHTGYNATLQATTASKHNGTYGLEQYGEGCNYTTPSGLADAYIKAQPGGVNEYWTSWNSVTVDLTAVSSPEFSFWYAMEYEFNNNYNNFWVQIDDGTGWVDLFATQADDPNIPYEKKTFDLSAYTGGIVDIRFFHNSKYDDNYLYLDNISVSEFPCPEPTDQTTSNVTTTSVNLSWTENGTATLWDIEYGAVGYAQGTGTTIAGVASNPYTLSTGIVPGTAYDWYVRANCGGCNGQSFWAGPDSFSTLFPNMEYASSTTTQNTHNIAAGKTNQQIIGIEIETTGSANPLSITSFTINANGSSTPVSTNIENAKIYCTGTSNTFSTDTQFGSTYTSPTTTNFDVTGTQQLSEETNYFWLTFDTKTGATIGELIDAECISFIIEGSTETPTATAPAGNRTLSAPLSGSYTIGAKSNYTSFTDAVYELMALGISAPVTFTVSNGTYTEQILLSEIAGASAADTVIFQSSSGNRADVVLQYEPTSDPANHILKFDGTDHITFQNMTLNNTGTSAYGRVVVFAGASNNINVTGCNMNGRDADHGNDVDYTVIRGEGGTSNMASNITFDNDTIRYGSYGLYFNGGDNNNLETGIKISNSVFEDFYYAGIFLYYQDSVVVHSNKLTGKGVYDYEYGMFLMYCYGGYEITANMVFLSADVVNCGIKLLECHASAARYALVANNYFSQVSTNGAYGIDVSDCSYQKIYHNSINMRSSAKSGSGGKSYPEVGCHLDCMINPLYAHIELLNNIIKCAKKAIIATQDAVNNSYLENSNHNDWFTLDNILGSWGSIDCPDLAAWQTACGMDASSVDVDPEYENNSSALIENEDLNGSVPKQQDRDLFNNFRNDNTAPGASDKTYNKWLGTQSSNPDDPNNWSKGEVPGSGDNVFIGPDAPYDIQLNDDTEWNDLLMDSEFDNNSAAIDLGGHTLSLTGNFISHSSYVQNGTLNFIGSNNQNYDWNGYDQPSHSYNVYVNKLDGSTLKIHNQFVPTDLTLGSGTIDANNKKIKASGNNVDFSGGSVTNPSEIEFTSSQIVQFNPGNNALKDLNFSGGGTYYLQDKLSCQGYFQVTGTFIDNGNDSDFWAPSTIDFENGAAEYAAKVKLRGNGEDGEMDLFTKLGVLFCQIIITNAQNNAKDNGELTVKIHGELECDTLTIGQTDVGNGNIMEILPGSSVTVNDQLIINNVGSIEIKSDVNETASFICNNDISGAGSSNITVEQYVADGQWHLISSPVANATVNSLYFNGSPDVWLTDHNETDDSWTYITSLATPMPFGKGFGYWVGTSKTDVTALFEGDILTDNLTLNSSSTPPLAFSNIDHGFNLVGNPYSCALDWDIGTWELTNLEGSVWVWEDAGAGDGSGNYLFRNQESMGSLTEGIIPMCQGFFVRATTSAPVLTIPTDARVHSTQQYYKDGERDVAPHIILNVSKDENKDEVWIGFDEETTTGFDNGRDVTKFFGSTDVPQLYLSEQEYRLSIDILPPLTEEERLIAMGFIAGTEGTHKITAASLENMPETDIILEDLKTGVFQKLNDNPEYSFTGTPEDDPERFLVHFHNLSFGIDYPNINENNKEINIYAYDKTVYIKCKGETINQTGTVSIYDMYGRLLINKGLEPNNINRIYVPVSNSYLVVKVIKDDGVYTGKVYVR